MSSKIRKIDHPSRKINHLSKVICDRRNHDRVHQIYQFHQNSQSLRWTLKSPKIKTLADGLIERTSSMLDKTESKTMHRDEEGVR